MNETSPLVVWFEAVGRGDVARVGGKNASLGEMVGHLAPQGVRVPPGFATTADAYWRFVAENDLEPTIVALLGDLAAGKAPLAETGLTIRRAFLRGEWPTDIASRDHKGVRGAVPALRQGGCRRSGAVKRHRRGFARRELCRPAGNRSSIFAARPRCSTPAGAATRRCSPTAPSPIGRPRASIT